MNIPQNLKERLYNGKVIPFVGAGISMAVLDQKTGKSLFPSWHELLVRSAERLDAEEKHSVAKLVRTLLEQDPPEYLNAAQRARDGLGAIWIDFLKEQLDHPRMCVNSGSMDLAQLVWKLGSPLIITTNYDRVLHWACPQQDDLNSWDIEAPAEQVEVLQNRLNRPTIWHLHGSIDNATNIILTPDGYSRLYPKV